VYAQKMIEVKKKLITFYSILVVKGSLVLPCRQSFSLDGRVPIQVFNHIAAIGVSDSFSFIADF
jgi:hypothetical protein